MFSFCSNLDKERKFRYCEKDLFKPYFYGDGLSNISQELFELIDSIDHCCQKAAQTITDWCSFNCLNSNWNKTFIMFVTTNEIKAASAVEINVANKSK